MREKILNLASELLQNPNIECGYTFIQNGKETYKKSMSAIDAYMMAYEMSKDGDIKCYMTALKGEKSILPAFTVINNIVTMSGHTIK